MTLKVQSTCKSFNDACVNMCDLQHTSDTVINKSLQSHVCLWWQTFRDVLLSILEDRSKARSWPRPVEVHNIIAKAWKAKGKHTKWYINTSTHVTNHIQTTHTYCIGCTVAPWSLRKFANPTLGIYALS